MRSTTGMTSFRLLSTCLLLVACSVSSVTAGDDQALLRGKTKKNDFAGRTRRAQGNDAFDSCSTALLSQEVTADGIISQNEFCAQYSPGCEGGFNALPIAVQLVFVDYICPRAEGEDTQLKCLQSVRSLESLGEYGYPVNSSFQSQIIDPETQQLVDNICFGLMEVGTGGSSGGTDGSTTAPGSETTTAPNTGTAVPTSTVTDAATSAQTTPVDGTTPPNAGGNNATMSPSKNGSGNGAAPGGIQNSGIEENANNNNDNSDSGVVLSDNGLGPWPIVGIAAAGAACLVLFAFVVGRRRGQKVDEHKPLEIPEGSFSSEDTPDQKFRPGKAATADMGDKSNRSSSLGGSANARVSSTARDNRVRDSWTTSSSFNPQSTSSVSVSIGMINDAIDSANWNKVYKVASQLAEREDLSTLSSAGKDQPRHSSSNVNGKKRSHLSPEDQERTKVLDDLVANRDWTGVAVTAALYAGESNSSNKDKSSSRRKLSSYATAKKMTSTVAVVASKEESARGAVSARPKSQASPIPAVGESTALGELKVKIDRAVDSGDWDGVDVLSSEFERNQTFRASSSSSESQTQEKVHGKQEHSHSTAALKQALDAAVKHEDWSSVAFYADQIKKSPYTAVPNGTSGPVTSTAIIPVAPHSSYSTGTSFDTSDTTSSKRQTIEKLIKAEKWKGVSIMAGLYKMET